MKFRIALSAVLLVILAPAALAAQVTAERLTAADRLWEREISSGVVAAPFTYMVDGEQYVAFNVG